MEGWTEAWMDGWTNPVSQNPSSYGWGSNNQKLSKYFEIKTEMKKYIFVTRKTIYSASHARTHHQSKSETLIMASSM